MPMDNVYLVLSQGVFEAEITTLSPTSREPVVFVALGVCFGVRNDTMTWK